MDNSLEIALKQEGADGDVANIARSIYQQESGSGKNTTTSNAGARGGMQIIPATFNRMADKGWSIDNPVDNARAGVRYINALYTKANGDPALTAAGYYGGEGAIIKAKNGISVSDPRNPNAPNTLQYGKQVADRLPNATFSTDEDAKFQAMYQQEKNSFSANEDAKFQAMYDAERKPPQTSSPSAQPAQPAPLSVTRNGKTITSSNNTLQDDLKAELAANPVNAKLAAAGTALSDIYQGGKQLLGMGDKQAIDSNKTIANANPGSAVAGNVALMLGTSVAAPVMNTARGITATGAIVGGLQPTENGTVSEHAGNALLGGATAEAGTRVLNGVGTALVNSAAGKAVAKAVNATKDASLKAAQDAGFSIPRSLYNPTFLSNRLESFGGKAAVKQQAVDENQGLVNNLTRQALNLPANTPLSSEAVNAVRTKAYEPYQQVAGLSTGAANALEDLKQNRADANAWFKSYNRSANPTDLAKAKDFQQTADIADQVLNDYAKQANRPELIGQLNDARKTIAKTYTVERAMNKGSGDIDSSVLASLFNKDSPLSDGLDQVGRFASTFSQVAPKAKGNSGAGISALDAATAAVLAGVGAGSTGSPEGLAAGAIPLLLRPAARNIALSNMLKSAPDYSQNILTKLLKTATTSRYAPMALAGATVPALTK